jgi:hypothetical protein
MPNDLRLKQRSPGTLSVSMALGKSRSVCKELKQLEGFGILGSLLRTFRLEELRWMTRSYVLSRISLEIRLESSS